VKFDPNRWVLARAIVQRGDVGIGIPEVEFSDIQLFPNPTGGELRITNYELRKGGEIAIYNNLGQLQQLATFNSPLSTIDVSRLPAGIYFVKISCDDKVIVRKMVKQ
jgi:DNA-binding beta-propeller fold protein YncE